ncbi:TetR/AcrR family transcriptional regulator [Litoreibacter roseus]|uniref:HTH tetR-type domain-containing protein n=1 Tax=Litoreibacter roseus TaxID=2601869 RepID=A0A6N6JLU3_9RHOB|nr:TetR/AcrR family transcriptional regulator [Litoreibacter roseus]GFE67084.1 hypothetical protein KIN_41580 [Litoreibacter roseus]
MNERIDHTQPTTSPEERRYHHGDLRTALLDAGEVELAEVGPEAFSLRRVARRTGVSHAAPAHHFNDVAGLLTALAVRGFERLLDMAKAEIAKTTGPREGLLAYGLAYIAFAQIHTALFRLSFTSDRTDRADIDLTRAGDDAFRLLAEQFAALTGKAPFGTFQDMVLTHHYWAVVHGTADLLAGQRLWQVQGLSDHAKRNALRALLEPALPVD